MSNKKISGLLGMLIGGFWLVLTMDDFQEQGIVAIAIPLVISVLGAVYFFKE